LEAADPAVMEATEAIGATVATARSDLLPADAVAVDEAANGTNRFRVGGRLIAAAEEASAVV
jgi:hypothetical protein